MPRSSMPRVGGRPERTDGGGQQHYDENESKRYSKTPQTIKIQRDMTLRALVLLGPLVSLDRLTVMAEAMKDAVISFSCIRYIYLGVASLE